MSRRFCCLTAALLLSGAASAQSPDPTITNAVAANPRQVTVVFSTALTTTSGAPHFDTSRIRLLPGNTVPVSVQQNALARNTFTVTFTAIPESTTRICFDQVQYPSGTDIRTSTAQVCADVSRDPASLKEAWIAALRKVPRTSRDKDLFASGFVTTASEESAGGGDIALNPGFSIPGLNAFLKIKKATADDADARHFEAGARYRYTRPWKPDQLREIAAESDGGRLNELIRARQRNVMAGWLIDAAVKLEGDPTNFDVTNAVGESSLHLQTMTRSLWGRTGFWRGFVLPFGFEAGQSLGTTAPPEETAPADGAGAPDSASTPEVNRIARIKAGAGLTVFYDNPRAHVPLRRIELDVNAVLRHLFLIESRFNEETKKTDTTDDGLHGYGQVDLKVFFGETDAGRFGVKLSYNRGRLPPVYAQVNSFEFGFVIESGDGNGKAVTESRAAASSRAPNR